MSRMMIQAATTMNQLQQKLDIIGNNMANAETTGYQSRQADFSSLLFQQIDNLSDASNMEGRLTPDGIRVGSGARLDAINLKQSQGSIQETDRDLDTVLVNPNTYYQIQVTEGDAIETHYTRDGAFYLSPVNNNASVMLTTSDGHPILGTNGEPIVFAEGFDGLTIQSNGNVVVKRGHNEEIAGQIEAITAVQPHVFEATGKNAFRLPNLDVLGFNEAEIIQTVAPNEAILKNNALEQSNVNLADEMTELLNTQRSYQFNARTVSMGDEMMGLVNQLR